MALQELQVNNSSSPPTQSFGNVQVGAFSEITIVLKNVSSPSISISGNVPSLSAPFSIQSGGGAFTLPADGDTKNVVVRYTPTLAQFNTTTLNITHDAPNPTSPLPVVFDGTGTVAFEKSYALSSGTLKVTLWGGTDVSAADLKSIGRLSIGFDDQDELVFFPSNLDMIFRDLTRDMFNYCSANEVTVEVRLDGALKYTGKVDVKTVEYDEKKKECKITVIDYSHKIKQTVIADANDSDENPFGYSNGGAFRIKRAIEHCFQKVNPSATVIFNQDWVFRAWPSDGGAEYAFDKLFTPTSTFFFDPNKPFKTAADFLKGMCLSFGCIAGMSDYNTAYFVKRWKNSAITPTSLTGLVKEMKMISDLPKIDWVRVRDNFKATNSDEGASFPSDFQFSDGTLRYPDVSIYFIIYNGGDLTSTNLLFSKSGSSADEIAGGDWGAIGEIKEVAIDGTFRAIAVTVAKYELNYRNTWRKRYSLTLYGTNYSMTAHYSYDGKTLRPSRLEIDFEKNETILTAVDIS